MSFLARFLSTSLTAVLVSITVAWAPAVSVAPSPPATPESILLTPSTGPPETSVRISFPSCVTPRYISGVTWDGDGIDFAGTDREEVVDISVPANATPSSHDVAVRCATNSKVGPVYGTAQFTVTPPASPEITLDPTQGPAQTSVTVNGSQFNCPYVDLWWDDTLLPGTDVTSDGTFTTQFSVPEGSDVTTHTVGATCTDYPDRRGEAPYTVTDPGTNTTSTTGETSNGDTSTGSTSGDSNGNTAGDTNGNTTGDTTGNATGTTSNSGGDTNGTASASGHSDGVSPPSGGTAIATGWVVGPSLFGALLLLAGLFSLVNHRSRGPRWAHDHIRARLRPGAGAVALEEPRDTRSVNRTVRLEPHTDPGDQRLY